MMTHLHIANSTKVTFPSGTTDDYGTLIGYYQDPSSTDKSFFLTDLTPFHPLDYSWPDQPDDLGTARVNGRELTVVASLTGVVNISEPSKLFIGSDIPVKRGTPGWAFLVLHALKGEHGYLNESIGSVVSLSADKERRHRLSLAHTGCHLAALALNQSVSKLWNKPAKLDSLGHADFDQYAIEKSSINELTSQDTYRLGKSIRKAGCDTEKLLSMLEAINEEVNQIIQQWIAHQGAVQIITESPFLETKRMWSCQLPDSVALIPCGGTHVASLAKIKHMEVLLTRSAGNSEIVMNSKVVPASTGAEL